MNEIKFDADKLRLFKEEYLSSMDSGKDTFEFDGHIFFTGYAKYLIEYLELVIKTE